MEAVSCEGAGLSMWKSEELSKSDRPDLASAGYFLSLSLFVPFALTHEPLSLMHTNTCILSLSHTCSFSRSRSLFLLSLSITHA